MKVIPLKRYKTACSASPVIPFSTMEQPSIKFFQPADPNAPRVFSSQPRSLQPLVHAPKAKRPVGRPTPRRREASPPKDTPPPAKRIRASYSMKKKYEVIQYAKKHSVYQACRHFGLSTGTVGPWMSLDFSSTKATVYRTSGAAAVGTRATRSASSCYCAEHYRSGCHRHSTNQPIIQRNTRMGTEVHEEE